MAPEQRQRKTLKKTKENTERGEGKVANRLDCGLGVPARLETHPTQGGMVHCNKDAS
jgi:hypothetical protein